MLLVSSCKSSAIALLEADSSHSMNCVAVLQQVPPKSLQYIHLVYERSTWSIFVKEKSQGIVTKLVERYAQVCS